MAKHLYFSKHFYRGSAHTSSLTSSPLSRLLSPARALQQTPGLGELDKEGRVSLRTDRGALPCRRAVLEVVGELVSWIRETRPGGQCGGRCGESSREVSELRQRVQGIDDEADLGQQQWRWEQRRGDGESLVEEERSKRTSLITPGLFSRKNFLTWATGRAAKQQGSEGGGVSGQSPGHTKLSRGWGQGGDWMCTDRQAGT